MGRLFVMNPKTGDDQYAWPEVVEGIEAEAAVKEAERVFTETREREPRRYAFGVKDGESVGRITAFDPTLDEVWLIAPMAGGAL